MNEEQAMGLTFGWLGVLLLAAGVIPAAGQPAPVPQAEAADAAQEQQGLLAKAKQLAVEGDRLFQRGDVRGALTLMQQVLALRRQAYPREKYAHGHPDLAESINDLGFMLLAAGEVARAEALYREALAMYHALYPKERYPAGHANLALSINNLATLHQRAGEYARAEPLFREALAMYRAVYPPERFPSGHPDIARSLSNLGALFHSTGDYAQAEPLLRAALVMRRSLYPKERFPKGQPDLARSINNLGYLYQSAGEYGRAEPLLSEGLAMRRALYPPERFPKGHPDLATSINNLGTLYQDTGEHTRAAALFREALAMRRRLYPKERFPSGHPDLARSLNNLAAPFHSTGDYAQAEPLLREALAMYRALYPKERFARGHPGLAAGLNNLGELYHEAGDRARAQPLLCEALAMNHALYPKERFPHGHPDLAQSLRNLGFMHLAAGEPAQAEPLLREALAMYSQLLRQYADLAAEAESINFASCLPRTRDALLSLTRPLPASAAAYDALWDSRALLTRLQERRHRDLVASTDPETAKLGDELRRTRASLARLLLSAGRDADAHRQAALQLTRAKEDLEKRIAAKLQVRTLPPASAISSVSQLRAALPADAAFVDLGRYYYFEQDPRTPGLKGRKGATSYVAFVVRKGQRVARIELDQAAPIEAAWAAWRKALLAPGSAPATERAAARAFARLVWEPIRAALPADCRTVYLTPDGVLAQVPWAALPGTKPGSVLLEEHAVCLVPHGPWLLERLIAPARGGRQPADTLLAYGGIDYEGTLAAAGDKGLKWPALPGTAREQAQVVALARKALKDAPLVRSGKSASTEQLLADLPQARYAHLATHGFFADAKFRSYLQVDPKLYEQGRLGERRSAGARNPLALSGLVLAGANRSGEDAAPNHGIVTAEALIGLRLDGLELAVLSACETGLGESGGGEGVFGLQRAFHIAGCRNVIASLWQVDDEATAALMGLFYHNLWVEKLPAAEALRQAQLALYHHPERIGPLARARGPDFEKTARLPAATGAASARRAPPPLWAGFVLSGAGR
jgi:CHAT domain-containing protein/Tfp pilus assembly protein PilF